MAMVDMVEVTAGTIRLDVRCRAHGRTGLLPRVSPLTAHGRSADDVLGSEEEGPSSGKQADDGEAPISMQGTPWPGAIVHGKSGSGGLPYRVHFEPGVPQPAPHGIGSEPAQVRRIHDSEFIVVEASP